MRQGVRLNRSNIGVCRKARCDEAQAPMLRSDFVVHLGVLSGMIDVRLPSFKGVVLADLHVCADRERLHDAAVISAPSG
jgi:hypothetical protein